jgi:RNA polymerase sigma factor for flagellar operon FliA
MSRQPVTEAQRDRIAATVPFVEALARRVASSMPHSIDLGDLMQDGMIGLIDAAHRFDESRGIKFETFAERRVRGAMIDALRRDAWPRGVRRMRRQLEAAREELRRELGCEPTLADLAARVGAEPAQLERTIVRINTIESTSPLATNDPSDEAMLPAMLVPPESPSPDRIYEEAEVRRRVRAAIATLPPREQRVIDLYYFGDVTMKRIGAEIGVNESRVSQLHARAVQRLRRVLAATDGQTATSAILAFATGRREAPARSARPAGPATVVPYPSTSRASRSKSPSLNGLVSQRQPLSSRKRSASVPATSPVTKMTRRAIDGNLSVMAR